jgi:ABC-type phosphate transport system permease subunit
MLLLLAAVPAVAYGLFVPEGLIAPFRFDLAGPAAYGFGVLIGAAIGAVQRWAPRHV